MTVIEYSEQIREGNKMLTRGLNKLYNLAEAGVNENFYSYWFKLTGINGHLKSKKSVTVIDIPSYVKSINMVINNLMQFDTTGLNGRNQRTLKGIMADFTKTLNIWEVAYNGF